MRILIITTEPLPLPGFIASGAGLRIWGIGQGLRCRGFEVEIAMATDAVQQPIAEQHAGIHISAFQRERLTQHVRAARRDAVVMQHWGLMDRLGEVDCPLAIDLAGPHLLERYYWGTPSLPRDVEDKLSALRRADFLTCSGEFQRRYFLGFALQAGYDMADPHLLGVVPFSVSPELPAESEHDPLEFIFCGMLLPWQDPHRSIRALLTAMDACGAGRFCFVGGRHPSNDVSGDRFEGLIQEIALSSRSRMEPARPFGELAPILTRCGAAMDLMERNPERELAFTSRTVVYLACGLPVIHDDYSELSVLIAQYDAGWCLNPTDESALAQLLDHLLQHPEEIEKRREKARRLVRERLTWDRTIEPLARWCAEPSHRRNKEAALGGAEQAALLRRELESVRAQYEELVGRRLVKFSNLLRRLGIHKK